MARDNSTLTLARLTPVYHLGSELVIKKHQKRNYIDLKLGINLRR